MSTRIRTLGTYAVSYRGYTTNTLNLALGTWSTASPQTGSIAGPPNPLRYETMSDSGDTPNMDHPVNHHKRWSKGNPEVRDDIVGAWRSGGRDYETYYWSVYPPVYNRLDKQHMTMPLGLDALAVSRVPVFDKASWEGFVSLSEATSLADTLAVKSAAALGRYAATLYRAMRGGYVKKHLARDGKRALERLRGKLFPEEIKEGFKTLLSVAGSINNDEMEWRYGLKPMIDDCQKAAVAAQRLGDLRTQLIVGKRVYGRAKAETTRTLYESLTGLGPVRCEPYLVEISQITRNTVVASVVRRIDPSDPYLDLDALKLQAILEINGLNPSFKGFWELLPLSFVVDWFWNVSDMLESMEGMKTPSSLGMIQSKHCISTLRDSTTRGSGQWSKSKGTQARAGSSNRRDFTRVLGSFVTSSVLYVPPVVMPTKASQWFSMAQIIYQRLLGRLR